MKKILLMCLSLLLFASALVSCEDWTEPESKVFLKGDGHDDAYYAALRKWKAETDYDMAWGWFGGWGANATNLKNSLRGLPDSLYLAAIWGRWRPSVLTDAMKADMEYVQRVKGTKVVCTTITGWVGVDVIGGDYQNNPQKEEYFGWKPEWDTPSGWRAADGTDERAAQEASIRKYARMLADSVYTGGYSGIDLDYEPNVGGAGCKRELSNRDNFYIFVDELGKYLGPKSGTDKLLVIDGEINAVEGRCMPYFDYFIWQAYSTSSDSGLNTYISTVIRNGSGYMEPEELIRKLYHVRTCNRNLPRDIGKERPCLYYHIKQCKAPCQGYISKEEYQKQIEGVLDFLNGDYKKLLKELEEKMLAASEELRFEEAGEYRDLMQSVQKIGERQKITGSQGEDKDVIAMKKMQWYRCFLSGKVK